MASYHHRLVWSCISIAANPFQGASVRADTNETESEKIMRLLDGDSNEDKEASPTAPAEA